MRTVTIPTQTVVEAIQSVNYQVNAYVAVTVGVGSEIDGVFQFTVPQQFQSYTILNMPALFDPETGAEIKPAITDFSDLEAQYPNGSFSVDDLWPYIDRIRARG